MKSVLHSDSRSFLSKCRRLQTRKTGQNSSNLESFTLQSHKTQGFCVADFATPSDERRSRSKIFPLFIWIKEPCVRKFEGLERSKRLGISQTNLLDNDFMQYLTVQFRKRLSCNLYFFKKLANTKDQRSKENV